MFPLISRNAIPNYRPRINLYSIKLSTHHNSSTPHRPRHRAVFQATLLITGHQENIRPGTRLPARVRLAERGRKAEKDSGGLGCNETRRSYDFRAAREEDEEGGGFAGGRVILFL